MKWPSLSKKKETESFPPVKKMLSFCVTLNKLALINLDCVLESKVTLNRLNALLRFFFDW